MTIKYTEFVNASISISPTGASAGNFGIEGFLTTEEGVVGLAERFRSYTDLDSLGNDWSALTEVYKAGTAFYAQTPTPTDFKVLMSFATAQSAVLLGGGSDTVEELVAVSAGSLTITVDGALQELTGIDLSAATNYDDVATVLDTALTGVATVTHNGIQFEVNSATVGTSSTISFATADLAEPLGLTQHQGKIADGIEPETPVESLAVALSQGVKIVALDVHKEMRDMTAQATGTNTTDIADWCEAAKVIFMNTTNNLATLSAAIDSDVASQLKAKTLRFSLTTFAKNVSEYPGSSVFGRAASVNFESTDSTITLNLKQMPTITAEDLTPGEFKVLESKYCSAVVQIGNSVNAYASSRMASGSWLDTTHGLMWLEDRVETDGFNFLYVVNTKVPFTQAGINRAKANLERSCQAAITNGLAAPGFLPDGEYLPEGFVVTAVPLAQVPLSDKGDREYRGLSFKMTGAGALHGLSIAGEFVE